MGMETDAKGYVSERDRDGVFRTQLSLIENRTCFDCDAPNPSWLSLSFAIYLCLNCSGRHRQMGTHVSFVRSIDMDRFTIKQLSRMVSGGNKRARIYFESKGIPKNSHGYSSKAASIYKLMLDGDNTKNDDGMMKNDEYDKKKSDDEWYDQKMRSVAPTQKLGARQIDNSEFDDLFTQSKSNFNYQPEYPVFPDTNSGFATPASMHSNNPYGYPGMSNSYMNNSYGDSTFRTNTRIANRDSNDYWPGIEDTAQQNINELKEGIRNIISKGNKFYDKAKHWFNNI